jgi:tetratricopeptide (TPR) repeat protein
MRYTNLSKLYWSFGNKEEAIEAAAKAGNQGLIKFYKDGDYKMMEKEVDEHYRVLQKSGEYISELWMGMDYAKAGAKDKAIECFNNAVVLREAAITQLLMGQYEFLNIKFINLVQLKRKIRLLIKF